MDCQEVHPFMEMSCREELTSANSEYRSFYAVYAQQSPPLAS